VNFHYIIIGAGIVGLSTALSAAKAGYKVAIVDPFGINSLSNASTDESRLFRISYFENPAYVPLLIRAREEWMSLGKDLYVECGGFYAGPLDSELVDCSQRSAIENNLDFELFSQPEAQKRFPFFHLPDHFWAMYEPQAGYVRSLRATHTVAALAIEWGVQFVNNQVLGIEPKNEGWIVNAQDQNLFGNRIIVCSGIATSSLVPALSPFLVPEPHLLRWLVPDGSIDWTAAPGFGIMNEQNQMLYGFPGNAGIPGVKVGGHQSVDLDAQQFLCKQHLRGLTTQICATRSCTYDMSPDGHFILGEVESGLSVACGFSGHGFKFGSVIGDLVLQAADNNLPKELQFLSISRYLIRS
jgi:glycine/D-amino acid oxidase-like deaminating enzyme